MSISMAMSPISELYRRLRRFVILAGLGLVLAQTAPAQFAKRDVASAGPRALGLLELAANGKARLVPVVIMLDGKFYDASAYKASPVPMALESGTVYEAVRTGVSQGLFTVAGARQANNAWFGEGTWQSASAIAAAAAKKQAAASKPPEKEKDLDAPPVLRRPGSEKPKPPEAVPATAPAPGAAPAAPAPAASAPAASAPAASVPSPAVAPTPAPATAPAPAPPVAEEDAGRPVLRRGKPAAMPAESDGFPESAAKPGAAAPSKAASSGKDAIQIIPAISDASGPEPRPYAYSLKPEEEQEFRKKMLALAGSEINARIQQRAAGTAQSSAAAHSSGKAGKVAAAKGPQPSFEDVQLRVFDLSNSNEPVLVLTAKARMPEASTVKGATTADLQYLVSLVARDDLYGELHKAFSSVTDTRHLDAEPRMELIDAVDADGDGRGELLFRQVSDAGSAFVLYRVIGNQLWPLFEGAPGQ
jgi:hypothetical protein